MKIKTPGTATATVGIALLLAGCADASPGSPVVARAADLELRVHEITSLMASSPQVPNQGEVIDAIANLWVAYALLAHAVAEDSTLAQLDLDPLIQGEVERLMLLSLVDSVLRPDTAVSEDELERLFEEQGSALRVRARHIVLALPTRYTPEQRDSVLAEARALRRRALAGEDFAVLARQHSDDPGSAIQGGDIGFWERGQMVESFDDAAFALDVGEISEPVETAAGIHIIKVVDRRVPEFEESREEFRRSVQQRRIEVAESLLVASVEEGADITFDENAVELTKRVVIDPQIPLSRSAAERAVVRYEGGRVTLGEVRDFIQTRGADWRQQAVTAPDEEIEEGVLRSLARRELLTEEARERGFEVSSPDRDSLKAVARDRFVRIARDMGLMQIAREPASERERAIDRVVALRLREVLAGSLDPSPLSAVSFVLRKQYRSAVLLPGVQAAVEDVRRARGPQADPPGSVPPTVPGVTTPVPEVDTGGAPDRGEGDA